MLISKELLAQIKKIQIKSDRMATEILSGEYKTAFRGKGLNFDSIREYQFGDDIRAIDWKVTARMQEPFIRQYKEERQLSIMLILDLSASNDFGTQEKNKYELVVELASVLAALATKNSDKVGLMIVTDHVEYYVPPKQGKAHIFSLIKDLLTFEPVSKKTNLKVALTDAISLIPKNSVIFLISDFLNADYRKNIGKYDEAEQFERNFDYQRELKVLRQTQDLIAVSVRDPREFSLPNIGYVEIVNPETGMRELLNLNKKSTRKAFANVQNSYFRRLKTKFQRLGIDFLDLQTDKPYISSLLNLFLMREKRS